MLEFQIYILVDKIVKIRNQTKVKHWLFNRKAGNLIKNKYCKNQIHSYPKRGFSQSRQHIFNISIRDSIHRIHLAECRRAVTSTWQPVACLVASTRQSVAVRVPTPCRLSLSRDIHLAGQHALQIPRSPFVRPGDIVFCSPGRAICPTAIQNAIRPARWMARDDDIDCSQVMSRESDIAWRLLSLQEYRAKHHKNDKIQSMASKLKTKPGNGTEKHSGIPAHGNEPLKWINQDDNY